MSKLIQLSTKEDDKNVVYTGRFLGFIKDDEFNALVQKPTDVGPKLESKASQSIADIISKFDNMNGYRLVMVVKKKDDDTILKKTLYITEGLTLVVEVSADAGASKKITFQSKDNDTIVAQEID